MDGVWMPLSGITNSPDAFLPSFLLFLLLNPLDYILPRNLLTHVLLTLPHNPGGQLNRNIENHIENLVEILVLENSFQ